MKIGFIGCGNMGGALAEAASKKKELNIMLSNHNPEKAAALAEKTAGKPSSNTDIALSCKYIFLGVKPKMMKSVIEEILPVLQKRRDRYILVSMAASLKADEVSKLAGGASVIRIMPNTPCAVGKGLILYYASDSVSEDETKEFCSIMQFAGICDALNEDLIDAASAVSGCGPAFAYMFIEALADGGVLCGLPRNKALIYAAQTVLGAGEAVLLSGKHPGQLKDEVCSPGGTTIEGVMALEKGAFRAAAAEAVIRAYNKTIEKK